MLDVNRRWGKGGLILNPATIGLLSGHTCSPPNV